jgi:hypothetical protein
VVKGGKIEMKKIFLPVSLALCAALLILPAATFADESNVAKIDQSASIVYDDGAVGDEQSDVIYDVVAPGELSGGSVTVAPGSATANTTVTISINAKEGFVLGYMNIADAEGNLISVESNSDTEYTFSMPESKVYIEAGFKEDAPHVDVFAVNFDDVPENAWYASAVKSVQLMGLMNGESDRKFGSNSKTTRGMIVTILHRMEDEPLTGELSFSDVKQLDYFSNAVAWASENGIVNGYDNGKFGPNDSITRQQLAAVLYRYSEYKGYDVTEMGDLSNFTDASLVKDYAVDAMSWAVGEGLIVGSNNTLAPTSNATRAEVAEILVRYCDNIAE